MDHAANIIIRDNVTIQIQLVDGPSRTSYFIHPVVGTCIY